MNDDIRPYSPVNGGHIDSTGQNIGVIAFWVVNTLKSIDERALCSPNLPRASWGEAHKGRGCACNAPAAPFSEGQSGALWIDSEKQDYCTSLECNLIFEGKQPSMAMSQHSP
jgi:hypothetical protein